MTHALVTGAHGFVGQALCASLRAQLDTGELHSLTIADRGFDGLPDEHDVRVKRVSGDFGDAAVQAQMLATPPDLVFHLAGITSRQAEDDLALGLAVNLTHTLAFLERLGLQGRCPVVVYSSTIGVFGTPMPERITDDTVPEPTLSYGAQKRMLEIWLADLSRRCLLDAVWTLPTLRVIAGDLVSALSRYLQRPASELVEYQPQLALQAQFANWPPIDTDIADRLGFRHDGNVDQLIARALTPL